MKKVKFIQIIIAILLPVSFLIAQRGNEGFISKFELRSNDIGITRTVQPSQYFDRIGRKAALMGFEDGSFEMWGWPWKPLRNFQFQFFLGSTTTPIQPRDIAKTISITPEAAIITLSYESFTVREIIMVPVQENAAIILLDINTTTPLKIIAGFLPVMQPQWPAGIGGQYSYWDDEVKGYIISESRQRALFICGSPLGEQMTAPPAHMFADSPLQFKIEVNPEDLNDSFIPIVIAGGINAKYQEVKDLFFDLSKNAEKYYLKNYEYYKNLKDSTVHIITPVKKLNLAYEWSKTALHNLMVENPELGYGMVAGYGLSGNGGRPGFSWFFGGDCFINSLSFNSFQDFETEKDALEFTQKWQRQDNFPIRKKAPDEENKDIGKMAHELSQSEGLIDWWNDYHYGYNHADTTPWYLVAIGDYYRQSGDLNFIKKSWESIKEAYNWCLSKDSDKDGLMDLKGAGLGALEFGKYVHIYADFYTSAIWTKGIEAVINMADAMNDQELKSRAEEQHNKALSAMEKKFWIREKGMYSYGATEEGEQVDENTPWPATGMKFKVLSYDHAVESLKKMNSSELITDWGVRTLSNKSTLFDPVNYNYGAIWPFLSTLMVRGQYNYDFNLSAYREIQANAEHFFDDGAGESAEVFSGKYNTKLSEAYHNQGFSASGFAEPFLRGLVGLDVDAPEKKIYFAPRLPADWDSLCVGNIKVGKSIVELKVLRTDNELNLTASKTGNEKIKIIFMPSFGLGTTTTAVKLNGADIDFSSGKSDQAYVLKTEFDPENRSRLKVILNPAPELYLLPLQTAAGETDYSVKVLYQELDGKNLDTYLEGRGGEEYLLGVRNPGLIGAIDGGELNNGYIKFRFNKGNGEFEKKKIRIVIKQ